MLFYMIVLPNLDLFWRAATLVKRILAGARPGDLPVAQPTKIELMVTMKTATTLGIKIPQSIVVALCAIRVTGACR